ncbi:MAG: YjfB family protein [Gammaproteobacteria bacterium]|nr:YjfB family protein [Gammaproteobacteria bacterium]MDH5727454.1 YjfB family protein [Gammaproteobacteria bacterium]
MNSIVGGASVSASAMQTGDSVGILMQKKSMDIQKQSAQQLIEAVPDAKPTSNPSHMGNKLDVMA